MDTTELIENFHRLYYDGPDGKPLFSTTSWMGVPTYKCPFDTWVYQEIIAKTKPDIILETGVLYGGSSLYLASICDLLDHGKIIACDITLDHVYAQTRNHPRITLFESSSTNPELIEKFRNLCQGKRVMVILDSDHSEKHVSEELKLYAPFVSQGCYLICEDSNVNGHPAYPSFGPGPYEAIQKFLEGNKEWAVDKHCERLMMTFNPSGYLVRL